MLNKEILHFPAIYDFSSTLLYGAIDSLSTHEESTLFWTCKETKLLVGMNVYTLTEGDLIVLPPYTLVLPIDKTLPPFGYVLSLPNDILPIFAPKAFFKASGTGYVFSFSERGVPLLHTTFEALAENREGVTTALPYLLSFLENESLYTPKTPVSLPHLLRRALAYINEHVEEDVSTSQLAERYHVSESTLLRVFRTHLSLTPLSYRKQLHALLSSLPCSKENAQPYASGSKG